MQGLVRLAVTMRFYGRFPPDGESAPHTVSAKTNQRRHRRRVKGAMLEGWQAAGSARGACRLLMVDESSARMRN